MQLGVDFREGGKLENPEKNPRSTGEINYDNSIHMNPKFEIQHGDPAVLVIQFSIFGRGPHPNSDPGVVV